MVYLNTLLPLLGCTADRTTRQMRERLPVDPALAVTEVGRFTSRDELHAAILRYQASDPHDLRVLEEYNNRMASIYHELTGLALG